MQFETMSPLSGDLARVADRVACDVDLSPAFCERLTRALSQLWSLGGAAMQADDLARFDAILVRIVPTSTVGARIELSDRIARSPEPPRGVLLILAHDDIQIAGPILRLSPALADDDLVDVARRCGTTHMSAIAERPELSIRVTDVLVLRGDDDVRRVVVANPGARLSDKSFARLSLQTRDDGALGLVLVARGDLPDLVVRFLEANGSPDIRRALTERRDPPRDTGVATPVAKSILRAEDGWLEPYDFEEAKAILAHLPEAPQQIDALLRRLAHTDRFAEIVVVLAQKTGIPLDLAKHMLVSLDTEPFVKVARALGLKNDTVQEILMIGPWLHRLDARAREAAMLAFQTTDIEEARARVRRWAASPR